MIVFHYFDRDSNRGLDGVGIGIGMPHILSKSEIMHMCSSSASPSSSSSSTASTALSINSLRMNASGSLSALSGVTLSRNKLLDPSVEGERDGDGEGVSRDISRKPPPLPLSQPLKGGSRVFTKDSTTVPHSYGVSDGTGFPVGLGRNVSGEEKEKDRVKGWGGGKRVMGMVGREKVERETLADVTLENVSEERMLGEERVRKVTNINGYKLGCREVGDIRESVDSFVRPAGDDSTGGSAVYDKGEVQGQAVSLTDEQLLALLRRPPKEVPELKTRRAFRDFFRGLSANRMRHLLEHCYVNEEGKGMGNREEIALKVMRRMEVVKDVLTYA